MGEVVSFDGVACRRAIADLNKHRVIDVAPPRPIVGDRIDQHGNILPRRWLPTLRGWARYRIARMRSHVDEQDRTALVFLAGALWGALVSVGTIAALFAATAGAH